MTGNQRPNGAAGGAYTTRRVVPLFLRPNGAAGARVHDSESRATILAAERSCGCARTRLGESCHYSCGRTELRVRAYTTRRVVPLFLRPNGAAGARVHDSESRATILAAERSCGCARHDSESRATILAAERSCGCAYTTRRVVPLFLRPNGAAGARVHDSESRATILAAERSCGCARSRLGESCHYSCGRTELRVRQFHDSESRAHYSCGRTELRVRTYTTRRVVPLFLRPNGAAGARVHDSESRATMRHYLRGI